MEPVEEPKVLKSETVGMVRTTVNGTVLAALLALFAKITGKEIKVEDLLPYVPLFAPVLAVFYRLSLALSQKFPWLGVALYGINKPPEYTPPAIPLGENVVILPPEPVEGNEGGNEPNEAPFPPPPIVPGPPNGYAYPGILGTVVLILVAVALVIWIARAI